MASIGETIQIPDSLKIVGLSTGTLNPEWREAVDELVELVNLLSVKVKELEEAQNNGG